VEELRISTKNNNQNRMGEISLQDFKNFIDLERKIRIGYRKKAENPAR
jgi:hypothetical protein